MLQNHPFLVLAILSAMSIETLSLHQRLDAEFRKVLGQYVIAQGQKSLDFLQGLLVYIAWLVEISPVLTTCIMEVDDLRGTLSI